MLLDTHVWVRWIEAGSNPLPPALIDAIEHAPAVHVSAISWWEVAQLTKRGRLELPLPLDEWLIEATERSGVLSVPISPTMARIAAMLPDVHRDPADRIIIATALELGLVLASLDQHFPAYPQLQGRLVGR